MEMKPEILIKYLKTDDMRQAILNWQNAVGTTYDGQLENFLGVSLGHVHSLHPGTIHEIDSRHQLYERVHLLLRENHATMIKVWMARNK